MSGKFFSYSWCWIKWKLEFHGDDCLVEVLWQSPFSPQQFTRCIKNIPVQNVCTKYTYNTIHVNRRFRWQLVYSFCIQNKLVSISPADFMLLIYVTPYFCDSLSISQSSWTNYSFYSLLCCSFILLIRRSLWLLLLMIYFLFCSTFVRRTVLGTRTAPRLQFIKSFNISNCIIFFLHLILQEVANGLFLIYKITEQIPSIQRSVIVSFFFFSMGKQENSNCMLCFSGNNFIICEIQFAEKIESIWHY